MLGVLLGSLLPGVIHGVQDEPANQPEVVREAYAALFYGQDEGFLLGMRVLGQSLKESGSTRDMVSRQNTSNLRQKTHKLRIFP